MVVFPLSSLVLRCKKCVFVLVIVPICVHNSYYDSSPVNLPPPVHPPRNSRPNSGLMKTHWFRVIIIRPAIKSLFGTVSGGGVRVDQP